MEESFAKLEADLRGQLEQAKQELRDTIIKTQKDMMNELSQLLQGKGLVGNPHQDKGDPSFSPSFVTNTLKSSQEMATQGDEATSHQEEDRARMRGRLEPLRKKTKRCILPRPQYPALTCTRHNWFDPTISRPQAAIGNAQGSNRRENRTHRKERERMTFTPPPMPYKEVYKHLYEADLVRPYHVPPFQPPYPSWYDEKAHCEYHGGIPGHTIENCTAFKKLVQNMINTGALELEKPNVTTNPLLSHGGRGVNALKAVDAKKVRMTVSEIKAPLRWVYEQLCAIGVIEKGPSGAYDGHESFCEYHQTARHQIQNCPEFKQLVQELMDNREVEFLEEA